MGRDYSEFVIAETRQRVAFAVATRTAATRNCKIGTIAGIPEQTGRRATRSNRINFDATSKPPTREGASGYTAPRGNNGQQQQQASGSQGARRGRSHVKAPIRCSLCGGEHQLFSCQTFRKLPVEQRIQRARSYRVCEKCLKPKCSADRCNLGPCKHCQGNHNGLLCTVSAAPTVAQATAESQQ